MHTGLFIKLNATDGTPPQRTRRKSEHANVSVCTSAVTIVALDVWLASMVAGTNCPRAAVKTVEPPVIA